MKPILVIGGGLSGGTAAHALHEAGLPVHVVDQQAHAGGRMVALRGNGWLCDANVPVLRRNAGGAFVRLLGSLGLDPQLRVLQYPVVRGTTRGMGANDGALACGMEGVLAKLFRPLRVTRETRVGALRWDEVRGVFRCRDARTGAVLRDPVTGHVLEGSGVVVATAADDARRLLLASRFAEPAWAQLDKLTSRTDVTAAFTLPRQALEWASLIPEASEPLAWVVRQEAHTPALVAPNLTVLGVRLGREAAVDLVLQSNDDACAAIWQMLRETIAHLPSAPLESELRRAFPGEPESRTGMGLGERLPTIPGDLPVAVAGDWTMANGSAESQVESGIRAATQVAGRLRAAHRV